MIDLTKKKITLPGDVVTLSPVGFSVEKPKTLATDTVVDVVVADTAGNFGRGAYQPAHLTAGRGIALGYDTATKTITLDTNLNDKYTPVTLSSAVANTEVLAELSMSIMALHEGAVSVAGQTLTINVGNLGADTAPAVGICYHIAYPFATTTNPTGLNLKLTYTDATNTPVVMGIYAGGELGTGVVISAGTEIGFVLLVRGGALAASLLGQNQVSLISGI